MDSYGLAELEQRRRNLALLELQRAQYGIEAPLHVVNAIQAEQARIEELEQRLASEEIRRPGVAMSDDGGERERRMMEARFSSMETTLRNMETKLDQARTEIHSLDTRLSRVEYRLDSIDNELSQQRRITAPLSQRMVMAAGALMVLMLVVMIVLTWSVLR